MTRGFYADYNADFTLIISAFYQRSNQRFISVPLRSSGVVEEHSIFIEAVSRGAVEDIEARMLA